MLPKFKRSNVLLHKGLCIYRTLLIKNSVNLLIKYQALDLRNAIICTIMSDVNNLTSYLCCVGRSKQISKKFSISLVLILQLNYCLKLAVANQRGVMYNTAYHCKTFEWKTIVVRVEMVALGKTFTVACL